MVNLHRNLSRIICKDRKTRMQSLKIGQLLKNGKYEIRRPIGKGRYGEVFLAIWHHPEGPRRVAIKWFSREVSSVLQIGTNDKLHKEIQLLSAINHESVVQVLELESESGVAFLVEEYLAGGSLHEFIFSSSSGEVNGASDSKADIANKKISAFKFINIALNLAQGLDSVHAHGFFHGDIKPSNICFRDLTFNEAVLVDFGQGGASDAALLGRNGIDVAATLSYLPPERTGFVKEVGSASSDLYSLGVSLYELISREVLFNGSNPKEIVSKILCHIPVQISNISDEIPEQLSDVIQKLMRKNPSERYQTSAGLIADLLYCKEFIEQNKTIPAFALGRRDKMRELNYKIPMVGRRSELEFLEELMNRTLDGFGKSVFIGAPSGSGKSRLASEFSARARAHGMRILSAKFSEFERNVPFSAIGVALQEYAIWLRTQTETVIEEWRENIFVLLGEKGSLLSKRMSYFSDLLPSFPPIKKMQKEEETIEFYNVLAKLLSCLAADSKGYIIFLDDLQWADFESLEVVKRIEVLDQENALNKTLFLGTYRSDEVGADHFLQTKILANIEHEKILKLGPLIKKESDELVGYLIDESGIEIDKLKDITYRLTQGNPFFIYEYLKSSISTGVFSLHSNGDKWVFDESLAASVAMTRGAAGLVAERIRCLPLPAKEVILVASVLGNSIELNALKHVLNKSIIRKLANESNYSFKEEIELWKSSNEFQLDKFLESACEKLNRDHLINLSDLKLTFFHDKIRESAYELLDLIDKKNIHRDFAEYFSPTYLDKENTSQKVSSKDIFELAFHVIQGFESQYTNSARKLLYLAAQRATEVFSYAKSREYLETASKMFASEIETNDLNQWIEIHDLLADSLALSEQLESAINLYKLILERVENKLHRAELYAKLSEYNLFLFRYKESLDASVNGTKLINFNFVNSVPLAILSAFYWIPMLLFTIAIHSTGFLTKKTLNTREEEIRFRILKTLQMSSYYTSPICTTINQFKVSTLLIGYSENFYRAHMIINWGILAAAVGLEKLSLYFLSIGIDYFERFPNPLATGYAIFIKTYVLDFPLGRLEKSRIELKKAFEILSGVGESFWRSNSLLAQIQIDSFGLGSGDSAECSLQLIALWKQVKFEPTSLGCVMKNLLLEGNDVEVDKWMEITIEAGKSVKKQGFNTIDSCYANLAPGEIYLMRGESEKALPLLKEAFLIHFIHSHRVVYCNYSPIPLALAYVRLHKPFFAIFPLIVAWINILMNVKIFKPLTLFATGEFFAELKLTRLAYLCFESGINIARKNNWLPTLAEGNFCLGKLLMSTHSEYAESLIDNARFYYQERGQVFLENKCDEIFKSNRQRRTLNKNVSTHNTTSEVNPRNGFALRHNIEISSLLDIFLRLSSLTNKDLLLQAVLESFCSCTGADLAIVFLKNKNSWLPHKSLGVSLEALSQGLYGKVAVDKGFIDFFIQSNKIVPCIRNATEHVFSANIAGSVMVLPLRHSEDTYAYCYLANAKIDDLFNEHSVSIVEPISTQAAIALQNVHLLAEVAEKAELDAELLGAKAVQEALLPLSDCKLPGMPISHWYQAATSAGGDWLSYFFNPATRRIYLFVGDVTGHGFPSALISGVACGAVFASEYTLENLSSINQLSAAEHLQLIARATNKAVFRTGMRTKRLMTMCFVSLDIDTGEVALINAGHVPPLIIQESPSKKPRFVNPSSRLGYKEDSEFIVMNFQLNPGDRICIYTDGLTENYGPSESVLDQKQIIKILETKVSVSETCEQIVNSGLKIWADIPLEDDVSVLVAHWYGPEIARSDIEVNKSQISRNTKVA